MPSSTPEQELEDLLRSLFDADEFRRFIGRLDGGRELSAALAVKGVTSETLFFEAVAALQRRGEIDEIFFNCLESSRPKRAVEIQQVHAVWVATIRPVAWSAPLQKSSELSEQADYAVEQTARSRREIYVIVISGAIVAGVVVGALLGYNPTRWNPADVPPPAEPEPATLGAFFVLNIAVVLVTLPLFRSAVDGARQRFHALDGIVVRYSFGQLSAGFQAMWAGFAVMYIARIIGLIVKEFGQGFACSSELMFSAELLCKALSSFTTICLFWCFLVMDTFSTPYELVQRRWQRFLWISVSLAFFVSLIWCLNTLTQLEKTYSKLMEVHIPFSVLDGTVGAVAILYLSGRLDSKWLGVSRWLFLPLYLYAFANLVFSLDGGNLTAAKWLLFGLAVGGKAVLAWMFIISYTAGPDSLEPPILKYLRQARAEAKRAHSYQDQGGVR